MKILILINILLDEKPYQNILVYDVLYKTLFGGKPLCIGFNEVDELFRVHDGNRQLVLFGPEKYDAVYNRIRHLISLKMVLNMLFLIILQKSKLIHMILLC